MLIKKLSIIIPVYNEESTVCELISKVVDVKLINEIDKEIIIIDDASSDKSREQIQKFMNDNKGISIKFFKHEINQGKGGATHTGIKAANGEYLIIQDADLELDPEEFNILLKPILDNYADVVYGSRFLGKKPKSKFIHRLANSFLTGLSNFVFRIHITDMETCYKMMKTEKVK